MHPSDTTRERPTRVGIEGLQHKLRHNFSCCAALIASGQAGSGGPNSRGGTRGYDTNNDTTRNRADTLSPEVLEILVELVGIAPTTSSLRTMRSPNVIFSL